MDYQWRNSEYWVLANGRWIAFCEMVSMFSQTRLQKYLNGASYVDEWSDLDSSLVLEINQVVFDFIQLISIIISGNLSDD
jgi:hypothetical protein